VNTELAWQVIWIAAAVGALALWATLWWVIPARARLGGVWRWCLVVLVVVFFILPAPVPNFAWFEAPAFVVMLFEALFQSAWLARREYAPSASHQLGGAGVGGSSTCRSTFYARAMIYTLR
jgi:hypothetical protein